MQIQNAVILELTINKIYLVSGGTYISCCCKICMRICYLLVFVLVLVLVFVLVFVLQCGEMQ